MSIASRIRFISSRKRFKTRPPTPFGLPIQLLCSLYTHPPPLVWIPMLFYLLSYHHNSLVIKEGFILTLESWNPLPFFLLSLHPLFSLSLYILSSTHIYSSHINLTNPTSPDTHNFHRRTHHRLFLTYALFTHYRFLNVDYDPLHILHIT